VEGVEELKREAELDRHARLLHVGDPRQAVLGRSRQPAVLGERRVVLRHAVGYSGHGAGDQQRRF